MGNMRKAFNEYFEIIPANTPDLREIAYKLRYQVYCLETRFEDADSFPDKMEKDAYDDNASISLLKHRKTDSYAGTVRLIIPDVKQPDELPFYKVASDRFFLNTNHFPPSKIAEVSRFAISKQFRKRLGERNSPSGATTIERPDVSIENRVIPHIVLGLFVGMVRMSAEHGIKHWLCVMEPALVRLLGRYGLHFYPKGQSVHYHGIRQTCYTDIDDFLARAYEENQEVWSLITDNGKYYNTGTEAS